MMRPARDLVTFGLDWLLAAIMLAMVAAAFALPALVAGEREPQELFYCAPPGAPVGGSTVPSCAGASPLRTAYTP